MASHDTSPACRTAPSSTRGSSSPWRGRAVAGRKWRSRSSTWTHSNPSTTASVTNTATTCLAQVADAMRSVIRGSDTVSRLGGDEFVVVIEDFDDSRVLGAVIERLFAAWGVTTRSANTRPMSPGAAVSSSSHATVPTSIPC